MRIFGFAIFGLVAMIVFTGHNWEERLENIQ
jgi:hypothetical protein